MERGKVDLRTCDPGDKLISALGGELEYVGPTEEHEYLDHKVKYISIPGGNLGNNSFGTRTHDGFVFKNKRIPETDHDIVKIIKKKK